MRFEQLQDGSWLDSETSLVWKEYPEEGIFSYDEALNLQNAEWMLPSIEELRGVVDCTVLNLATELPNMMMSLFWSGSPGAGGSDYAWGVNFGNGDAYYYSRNFGSRVRLVRDASKVDSTLALGAEK